MIPLSKENVAILKQLLAVWDAERFLVIGAAAVSFHTGLEWRGTVDLDLTVACGIDEYQQELERLGWSKDSRVSERWIVPGGAAVDVVPSGSDLIQKGEFTWPDGGERLTLTGFRLAYDDAISIEIAPGSSIRLASLRSLVVLKITAYLDRPWERDNDLKDIVQIMNQYVRDDDERRWSDEMLALSLNFEDVGPFILGQEIGGVVDPTEREMICSFLEKLENPSDPAATLHRMTEQAPRDYETLERLRQRLGAFKRGFVSHPG